MEQAGRDILRLDRGWQRADTFADHSGRAVLVSNNDGQRDLVLWLVWAAGVVAIVVILLRWWLG